MGSPEWAARWASGEVIPETQQRLRTQVLAVWPTPSVGDVTGSRTVPVGTSSTGRRPDGKKAQIGLQTAVRSVDWPTPRASEDENRQTKASPSQLAGEHGWSLGAAVNHIWPTPSASMPNDTESPESWLARAALLKEKHRNGNGAGMPLAVAVKVEGSAWPTPTARDWKGGDCRAADVEPNGLLGRVALVNAPPGPLSPDWVEMLMGFPAGWTRIDGPRAVVKRSTKANPRARRRVSRSDPQG